jgi:hypothetical protein
MNIPFTNVRWTLHPDWKRISTHAWSMRLNYASLLYSGIDASLSYAMEGRIGATLVAFGVSVGIGIARIVHQETVSGPLPQGVAE